MTSRRALQVSVGVIVLYWVFFAAKHLLQEPHMPDSVAAIALSVSVRVFIVAGLAWILMRASGESLRDLGFAHEGAGLFMLRSTLLAMGLFVVTNVVLNSLFGALLGRGGAPPIAALFRDPRDAPLWIYCAIVGGGIAEELARAFVLTRFDRLFGRSGLIVALVSDSAVFGLGHLYQGRASALSTAVTGALLGLVFLWRRRVIDAMAVHTLFDLMGIAAAYALYAR
jgi:membrane protease YdiL (CAAX protease family)